MRVKVQRNWRSKPHPYWFRARYPSGGWTVQCMWLNVWGGK